MRSIAARVVTIIIAVLSPATALAQHDFSTHWHDGRAELDGYQWTVTRYAQSRSGEAVMIFVTEPFSDEKRVKVDDPTRDPSDTLDVLKLNLIRDFQTGIYDYNTMTSVFAGTGDFAPLKITFSSAEWCGHVYEEMLVRDRRIEYLLHSYFEGESADDPIDRPRGGVTEDNLYILLRGLRGPYLQPGEKRTVPFLPSAFHRRLTHKPATWTTAEIERLPEPEQIEVPAGTFTTIVYVVHTAQMREGRFHIEQAHPHRIIRWEWGADVPTFVAPEASEVGVLTGTDRVKYWQLHDNGDERALEPLGLPATREGE